MAAVMVTFCRLLRRGLQELPRCRAGGAATGPKGRFQQPGTVSLTAPPVPMPLESDARVAYNLHPGAFNHSAQPRVRPVSTLEHAPRRLACVAASTLLSIR